jgi:hypothetical protein
MNRERHVRDESEVADRPSVRPPASRPEVTGWMALQQAGNRAVGGLLHRMAEGSASISFPHRTAIAASTGSAVPGSAIHDPFACAERGVPAFTDGLVTRFASTAPPVHVAAHEAAHQLQHAGRTNDHGLGAERHAHGIAEATAAGRSARDLVGASGAAVGSAVRDYTELPEATQAASGEWRVGGTAKVGDQGRMVITSTNKHLLYADPVLITEANAILQAKKSGVRIEPGPAGPSGQAPDGSGFRTTVRANYKILMDEDNEEFYADCGVSAREVQGPSLSHIPPRGIYKDTAGTRMETTARSTDPADFRNEILVRAGLGADGPSALTAYYALNAVDKDAFDKKHGINRYAAPGIGEAYTRRRDDARTDKGYNFHWAGVIMMAGGDRVTFENYTKGGGTYATDDDWYFGMYGSPAKPHQTFHEYWARGVGEPGLGTTMAAATSPDPSPFIPGTAALPTVELIKKYRASAVQAERMAIEGEMGNRWVKVTVLVKKAQEGTDDVYVEATHAGRRHRTGEADMRSGDKQTFWVPLGRLAPITGKIIVSVYDYDTLSGNDMISIIHFDDPYAPAVDNRPWDGAEYHTTVEFDR